MIRVEDQIGNCYHTLHIAPRRNAETTTTNLPSLTALLLPVATATALVITHTRGSLYYY